jgi:hypothetical protein
MGTGRESGRESGMESGKGSGSESSMGSGNESGRNRIRIQIMNHVNDQLK